ncbi:MAG: Do family serine endopeptidase [Proteobacteria bacterium]|nr:Do family serine endopeptidase [Pseudomonadota bacterium]
MTPFKSSPSMSRRSRFLASAAAIAFLGAGAIGSAALQSLPARAAPVVTSDLNANAMPSFSKVVDRVKPAVVSVKVKMDAGISQAADTSDGFDQLPPEIQQFFKHRGQGNFGQRGEGQRGAPRGGMATAQGSGFFISADGYVVTNNHVVQSAKEVTVVREDGSELSAKVVGPDPTTDRALLKVNEKGDYPFVSMAKDAPSTGDWVVAIGNPFGLGGTVTAGIVSAHGRDIGSGPYDDYLQIDAPINKGNSGGPTFNLKGEVVGVNTAIYSPSGGSVGLGFAIPARTVTSVVNQLENGGKVERAFLGVKIQPVTRDIAESLGMKDAAGAIVDSAEAGTPAAKAGLKSGDVIVKVDGTAIKDARDLTRRIGSLKPGETVKLGYLRNGREEAASITLAGQQDGRQAKADLKAGGKSVLGVQLAPARDVNGAGDKGVAIVGIDPNGQAAAKGLSEGDVILEVGGKTVETAQEVKGGLDQARQDGRKAVLLKVKTADGSRFVAIGLPAA